LRTAGVPDSFLHRPKRVIGTANVQRTKTIQPRSQEAETGKAKTHCRFTSRACFRADRRRTCASSWRRPYRRKNRPEIRDVAGSQTTGAESTIGRGGGASRGGTQGRGCKDHASPRASTGQGSRRSRCGESGGDASSQRAAPANSRPDAESGVRRAAAMIRRGFSVRCP
jgi:hypothetical protein